MNILDGNRIKGPAEGPPRWAFGRGGRGCGGRNDPRKISHSTGQWRRCGPYTGGGGDGCPALQRRAPVVGVDGGRVSRAAVKGDLSRGGDFFEPLGAEKYYPGP